MKILNAKYIIIDYRYRQALITLFLNVISKVLSMAIMLLAIYLAVPYIGTERYGIWVTVASMTGVLTFFDLGVGNALTNVVAQYSAKNKKQILIEKVSGGIGALLISAGIAFLIINIIAYTLPWEKIIKVNDPEGQADIKHLVHIFSIVFSLSLVTNGLGRVYAGLQRGYIPHAASTIGTSIAILLLYLATNLKANMEYLYFIVYAVPNFFILFLIVLMYKEGIFDPKLLWYKFSEQFKSLYSTGKYFLLLQLGVILSTGFDLLIVSNKLGAESAAIFSIALRMFQFVSQPLTIINAPLWGAYADAHANNDYKFISKTLKRSFLFTTFSSMIGCFIIFLYSKEISYLLTRGTITSNNALIAALAIWTVIETAGISFSAYKNGCGILRPQVLEVASIILLSIPAKLLLIDHFGLITIPIAASIAYITANIIIYLLIFKKETFYPLKSG